MNDIIENIKDNKVENEENKKEENKINYIEIATEL